MGDLSKNFSLYEFQCKDNCGYNAIDFKLMPIMEIIRTHEGSNPLTPNSACRCVDHNETIQKQANKEYVPHTSKSKHMEGIAVDIKSENPKVLFVFLDSLFPDMYGIGLYSWGIHILH